MQNPEDRELEARLRDPAFTSFDSLENASIEPIDPAPPVYKDEPLFNKTAMLAWAIGAAVVWFAVSFVLPIAFESAKTAIVESIKEAEKTGSNVVIERDGQKITITTKRAPPATITLPAPPATPAAVPDPLNPAQGPAELQSHRK